MTLRRYKPALDNANGDEDTWKHRVILTHDPEGPAVLYEEAKALENTAQEMYEALKAWENWYTYDSSEFNRDMAQGMGLTAIAKARAALEGKQ